jgi:hypothetical protein
MHFGMDLPTAMPFSKRATGSRTIGVELVEGWDEPG